MGGRGGSARARERGAAADSDAIPPGETRAQQALIDSYWESVRERNLVDFDKWVRFPEIRELMSEKGVTSRAEQDKAIAALALRPDTRVSVIANLKSLSAADLSAAIRLGGEEKTVMLMYRPSQLTGANRPYGTSGPYKRIPGTEENSSARALRAARKAS